MFVMSVLKERTITNKIKFKVRLDSQQTLQLLPSVGVRLTDRAVGGELEWLITFIS